MDVAEYKRRYPDPDEAAPGWDAIDAPLKALYGEQEPMHWGTAIKYLLGGPDPIDGISAYECREGAGHLHFITYGYSNLYYGEEYAGQEYSGYGFEMTFRLASPLPPAEPPYWVLNLLQNLARYVFQSNKVFMDGHWIPANGPIKASDDTELWGLAFLNDPKLPAIDTPHGKVEFVQAFGITRAELDALKSKETTVEAILARLRPDNPLLVTDLSRRD